MAYIKEELEGIFFIENVFIYDTITKTVEYDDDIEDAEENANSMLQKWKEECFVFKYVTLKQDKVLFVGRIKIETGVDGYKYNYKFIIFVDGIKLVKIKNDYFGLDSQFSYHEIVYFFNDIAVSGVDSFLEKYIKSCWTNSITVNF